MDDTNNIADLRYRTVIIAALALAALIAVAVALMLLGAPAAQEPSSKSGSSDSPFSSVAEPSASSAPVSFEIEGMTWDPTVLADARAVNPDVYAWLYVPGTYVNHPILQSQGDEDFYLTHDLYGNGSGLGELYSQPTYNGTDFKDPVTLIYGHTYEYGSGLENEMFSSLHNFEDGAFFDEHPYFYIFMPDKVLRYEIVSIYENDDRHVLYTFDFTKHDVLKEYFDYVVNPPVDVKNVREGITLKAGKDTIVQLSTCTRPANDAYRYLVTGKLKDSMPL